MYTYKFVTVSMNSNLYRNLSFQINLWNFAQERFAATNNKKWVQIRFKALGDVVMAYTAFNEME